jgi:Fur family ferric uptake transcriptional regulator
MVAERERQELIEYIRSRGMRVTPERMALLDEVYRQHGHIDAEEILDGLRAAGAKVSRATVYRNLDLLVECGLVQRQRLGRNRFLYEHVHAGQQHDHLACRRCGRVVEFVSPSIQAMLNEICRAHGFSREDRQLQIFGLCEGCVEVPEAVAEAAAPAAGGPEAHPTRSPGVEGVHDTEAVPAEVGRVVAPSPHRAGGERVGGRGGDPIERAVGG